MASIDQYKHKILGYFYCPSDYNLVYGNSIKQIAIYQLLEDIPISETDFNGTIGDIIVGGGSGEASSLRISQKGIDFFLKDFFDDFESNSDLVKTFWTPNFSFIIGTGLLKLGWNPKENMEFWMADKIVKQLFTEKS